jgi:hypothetical protein
MTGWVYVEGNRRSVKADQESKGIRGHLGTGRLGAFLTNLTNEPLLPIIFDMTAVEIPNLFIVSAKSSHLADAIFYTSLSSSPPYDQQILVQLVNNVPKFPIKRLPLTIIKSLKIFDLPLRDSLI